MAVWTHNNGEFSKEQYGVQYAYKTGFPFLWFAVLWALLRSVKHHIKTNLHLTVSGEYHDTSSQSKVRRDGFFSSPLMFTLPIRSETTAPAMMSLLAHTVNQNTRRDISPTFYLWKASVLRWNTLLMVKWKLLVHPQAVLQKLKIVGRVWSTLTNCHLSGEVKRPCWPWKRVTAETAW